MKKKVKTESIIVFSLISAFPPPKVLKASKKLRNPSDIQRSVKPASPSKKLFSWPALLSKLIRRKLLRVSWLWNSKKVRHVVIAFCTRPLISSGTLCDTGAPGWEALTSTAAADCCNTLWLIYGVVRTVGRLVRLGHSLHT